MVQWMLAIWSLVHLPFLKPAWTSGSSWFTYYWRPTWRILSIALLIAFYYFTWILMLLKTIVTWIFLNGSLFSVMSTTSGFQAYKSASPIYSLLFIQHFLRSNKFLFLGGICSWKGQLPLLVMVMKKSEWFLARNYIEA